tara:strand:- start:603 stop:770 length:168 start_codon:yes stop_codon:yes gene_type:complete
LKKTIINNSHVIPTRKNIGASLKVFIENTLFAIGIKPVVTKTRPNRYASRNLVMI